MIRRMMLGLMVAIGALGLQAAPAAATVACSSDGPAWQYNCTAGGVTCKSFFNGVDLKMCFH